MTFQPILYCGGSKDIVYKVTILSNVERFGYKKIPSVYYLYTKHS